jgi:hypothetical protein
MDIPAVGTKVTVTTRHPQRSYWHTEDYVDNTLTGNIIPSPKWLTSEQIAISNPAHPNGFSIISISKITNIMTADGAVIDIKPPTTDYKEWNFVGSKGDNYLVIRSKGNYSCTCTGFQFRKQCKHVKEATDDKSN